MKHDELPLVDETYQAKDGKPLCGLRVIDLMPDAMAGIARHFAELGADVVRIEPAAGGPDRRAGRIVAGVSVDFVAANLGKRSATPDQIARLARDADIVVTPRGGVDHGALRAENPALVILTVSDFGDTGQFANWIGSDAVFHALSGELSRSGAPNRQPLLPPGELAIAVAVVQAVYVALLAYWNRLRTGYGDCLDFSILDGATQALDPGYGIGGSAAGGVLASKLPRGRPDVSFMYPIYPCTDGFIRLCVLAPRQWQNMFEWMGRPEAFASPEFNKMQVRFASPTLMSAMAAHFAGRSLSQALAEAAEYGVPAAAVLSLSDALKSEQIVARRSFLPVRLADGVSALFPDGVMEIDRRRMGIAGPPPALPQSDIAWRDRPQMVQAPALGDRLFSGLKVLDFGVIVVGAETGRLLADQGADVIKVESSSFPDGSRQSRSTGPISPTFATGHRNRRSIGINLRDPRGKDVIYQLIRETDVVLSNFKGGTLQSLGLDYATLRAINPAIIVVDSSAFGPTGPWAQRMGYGPLVRASAGLTMQWRYPGEPESFADAMTVYPDHVAARIGAIGVISLLIRRLKTGGGGEVSVSQAEVMLGQMAPMVATEALEHAGHRVSSKPGRSAVYAAAGDDEWCVVSIRDAADEARVAAVTGGQDLAVWIGERSPRECMEVLQAACVPAAAMLRVSELPAFDYYTQRGFFRQSRHPHISEVLTMEADPVRAERLPSPPDLPAPLFAEHTSAVLRERLNLPESEIETLLASGAIEEVKPPTPVQA
ncbi:CaiB/BaiF CoA-transferase family protein [Novosphingobium cyanobacteriorum]|uniref:CoA transferase n=1 Tax=Novosphingobium cyanobacteriorum TaxID=3024215 RepID=A0ABT6CEE3_9SPHN|nr:CoA transferase [Novosphingobium cyanobacteriorum]MDF8332202.1 CoA transferase [Novosphingobium cyanobacteriorum]